MTCYSALLCVVLLIACAVTIQAQTTTKIGFCLNNVPSVLVGTGFTAQSNLTQLQCTTGGFKWCPLLAKVSDWEPEVNGVKVPVKWYYFSGCCTGRQGQRLIPDPASGLPTCIVGMPSSKCVRWAWTQKLEHDLGLNGEDSFDRGDERYYDYQVAPFQHSMDPKIYGGQDFSKSPCICAVDSPNCQKTSEDGKRCIWCKDIGFKTRCNPQNTQVRFGFQVFKLHSVDLFSSLLSFQGWQRTWWYDMRFSYDYQCHGGLAQTNPQAQPGSLENSRMWVPDVELINNEEVIWGGSMPARLAIIYACWNGNPSRGGCGYVWTSKPAVIRGMCKFGGLVMFPMDSLTCELEIAAWATTGNEQDLIPHNSGITWSGGPIEKHAMAGITGGSQFQDYTVDFITTRRDICLYHDSPGQTHRAGPTPTLIFEFTFVRSNYYYQIKLFIPGISLTFLAFGAFWLEPSVGERLGFGMAVILAVIMNDVVAMTMMPICDATLLMDYISLVCFLYAVMSLIESCIVLNLYFRTDRTWFLAFMPPGSVTLWEDMCRTINQWRGKQQLEAPPEAPPLEGRAGLLRMQLYKETYFALDRNNSGSLDMAEVHTFGQSVLSAKKGGKSVEEQLLLFDADGDGKLNFAEFTNFLECSMKNKDDIDLLTKLLRGFIRATDREFEAICEMWRTRATTIDTICRVGVPFGYFLALGIILTRTEADLEAIQGRDSIPSQWVLKSWGFVPFIILVFMYASYCMYRCRKPGVAQKTAEAATAGGGGAGSMDEIQAGDAVAVEMEEEEEDPDEKEERENEED